MASATPGASISSPSAITQQTPGRTKIVATVGPASRAEATLQAMVQAGTNVFRLNFSHGTHEEKTETLQAIRRVGRRLERPLAVIQDLSGPKMRLGTLPGDQIECPIEGLFELVRQAEVDQPAGPGVLCRFSCTYDQLVDDLQVGEEILFADGQVIMRVESVGSGVVRLRVELPGPLGSRQGINLPGTDLSINALTEKDLHDLDWAIDNPIDYIALSFVRRAEEVEQLREEMNARGIRAGIISKIEKPQAVDDLLRIVQRSDAIMVARGDLGVEMDVARVPAIQKRIISMCNEWFTPVITATQMLNSMEESSRPTRAEASDVVNAVLDGTDAVMLSGETAVGRYPVETIAMMRRLANHAETLYLEQHHGDPPSLAAAVSSSEGSRRAPADSSTGSSEAMISPITLSVVEAANRVCRSLPASLLVVATRSGGTALALSRYRSATPTLAVAENVETARAMALYWGVTPLVLKQTSIDDIAADMDLAVNWAGCAGLVETGDLVVLIRGTLAGEASHNALFVQAVGELNCSVPVDRALH